MILALISFIVRAVGRSENPGVQVSKISRLTNGRFTTISSHFFGHLHYIFHRTEIQTVTYFEARNDCETAMCQSTYF